MYPKIEPIVVLSKQNLTTARKGKELLDPIFPIWLTLQSGQEKIIRFSTYIEIFGDRMRHQNGHEHRCSVCLLFTDAMIRMRQYCQLDELLLTRCINHHDEPEGISKIDKPAPEKTDADDLDEYLIFEKLYRPLGNTVWTELQKAFLLQFCLSNPDCFPDDAREVMRHLATDHKNEALFFDAVQRFDYLLYAFECFAEGGVLEILHKVSNSQCDKLDEIAGLLPALQKVVWTQERAVFFKQFKDQLTLELK